MSFTSKLAALIAVASMPLAACTYNTYNTTNEYTTPTSSSSAAPSSSSTSPSSDAAPQSDAGQSETSSDAGSDATPDPYGCYQLGQDPSGSFCSPGCAYVDGKPYHGPAVSDFCLCMVSGQLSCTTADAGSDAADSANDPFKVVSLNVGFAKGSDGSDIMLDTPDIAVEYNRNAQGVQLRLYDAADRLVDTYVYITYQDGGQKGFALRATGPCPNTTYTFIIEAHDTLTDAVLYTPGYMTTGNFVPSNCR